MGWAESGTNKRGVKMVEYTRRQSVCASKMASPKVPEWVTTGRHGVWWRRAVSAQCCLAGALVGAGLVGLARNGEGRAVTQVAARGAPAYKQWPANVRHGRCDPPPANRVVD